MKKIGIIIVNVIIMLMMLIFVVIYSYFENTIMKQSQIEHFKDTTVTMEHVTENYLEGEQRICDVWAQYIDNSNMTIDEAIFFIRNSHVLENTQAHIVYLDSLNGLSTKSISESSEDFFVSYERMELLNDVSWIHELGSSINISRAYTNPINGEQSIAFCNVIKLNKDGSFVDAILLRVLPISELKEKWVFPHEEFENSELSIIDANGNYIIKGYSFKNSNFFEFYRSYNLIDSAKSIDFFETITTSTGSLFMFNSKGEECILSYTPFDSTGEWTLLNLMPTRYLKVDTENWLLIGIVSAGLLLLFIFDLAFMIYFNKKLQASAKEADLANKAKTDFLSAMSHDIRTPMNAIIGFTTLAKNNIDDKKSVGDNLRKISLASNHLLTLINDILDISKVESGKLNFFPQKFSIVETVENLMNISNPMIKEKNIDFNFYVNNIDNEYLYADELRLNQILINILSNAIKYTDPLGHVSVYMMEEKSQIEGCVKFIYKVSDTGIGMSPEFMKNMYQPFSRQTDSRVNSIQGTGLGLAITKQMVDLMNGTIDCESEEGKGTTFTVILDIPVLENQKSEMKLDNMNVLLVDNDEMLLNTAINTFEALGINLDKTNNGLEAINMIKEKEYEIAIIDLKKNGIDIINRINMDIKTPPIILLSSYDLIEAEEAAKSINVDGFINKPFFKSNVFEKISEVIGNERNNELENDYSDLEGLNILVAEDHDVNWEIIKELLMMYGINTERAENGRICLDKIKESKKGQYLLIFMDIQMPEMNGLEATRLIRKLDNPDLASIPIIAMTSDAFSENVTECLNAGMNGHISKPIDIKIVIKEIRRIKEGLK